MELTERQRDVVVRCFNQGGGGSGNAFVAIRGHDAADADRVRALVNNANAEHPLSLAERDWRVVFDTLHAAMYADGPFELPIIVGSSLVEVADVNLRICVDVWGAYGGLTWAERH